MIVGQIDSEARKVERVDVGIRQADIVQKKSEQEREIYVNLTKGRE